ncbi:hypothetical protein Cgig2_020415 [Carnegiea gigantea]|uniref:Ubiquitin-like protease family profile domain-containing protein n=1 Tax=Carnegiea gigantea TaxID=171969 RepID=A0A9Q1K515_9CARY|nr:hypothetical protein Cgig2_020415 [Carnegiea gigantea]
MEVVALEHYQHYTSPTFDLVIPLSLEWRIHTVISSPIKITNTISSSPISNDELVSLGESESQHTSMHDIANIALDIIKDKLTHGEKVVVDYEFLPFNVDHPKTNCIYIYVNNEEVYEFNAVDKEAIASMAAADSHLENGILDVWSIIMNKNQLSKETIRPSRFFFPTYVYLLFPILRSKYFFLILFQFADKTVNITNNLKLQENLSTRYDDCDSVLKHFFSKYSKLSNSLCQTDCQDNINLHDCGIYTMHYMETYYGSIVKDTKSKYDARILLHLDNMLRDNELQKVKLDAKARQYQQLHYKLAIECFVLIFHTIIKYTNSSYINLFIDQININVH